MNLALAVQFIIPGAKKSSSRMSHIRKVRSVSHISVFQLAGHLQIRWQVYLVLVGREAIFKTTTPKIVFGRIQKVRCDKRVGRECDTKIF